MTESSREDFQRQSMTKNGTTPLSNEDPKKIEECRDIQLCVFNEHFGQDSQSRMSPKSFREEFQRQQTLKNGATVLQNQDTEKSKSAVNRNFAFSTNISNIKVKTLRSGCQRTASGIIHADKPCEQAQQSYQILIWKILESTTRRNFAIPEDIQSSSRKKQENLAISMRTPTLPSKVPHRPMKT